MDRDPQPEVARAEREALLERQDVGADVVDGVASGLRRAGGRRRSGDEQVVLAEHALARGSRAARPSRSPRPAGSTGANGLCARRAPNRCMSGSSSDRIDAMFDSTQSRRSSTRAERVARRAQPGVARDEILGPDRQRVEVGLQRRREVRVGERIAAGDEPGDARGPWPSRRDRAPALHRRRRRSLAGATLGLEPPDLHPVADRELRHDAEERRSRAAGRSSRTRACRRCGRRTRGCRAPAPTSPSTIPMMIALMVDALTVPPRPGSTVVARHRRSRGAHRRRPAPAGGSHSGPRFGRLDDPERHRRCGP